MKLNDYEFELGGGNQVADGESRYPDLVRLVIPKDRALAFAMDILQNLKNARPGEEMLFEIAMFGKLEPVSDE